MTIDELKKQIKSSSLKPIYFFYGDEQYLLNNALDSIEKKLITPGTEDFNKFVFEGKGTKAEEILEATEQYPQMSEKKLVIAKNTGIFNQTNSTDYKKIKEAAEDLPDYSCLIFTEENFDKKKEKNIKFIDDHGEIIVFDFMPINRVEIWLEDRIKKSGKSILEKDARYMIGLCGQSLGQLRTEIHKLLNYTYKCDRITREDIDAVVTPTVEYRVYEMLDNITSGRNTKAQEQLKYLKDSREQPTVILSQMIGKLSEVLMCKHLRECGLQPKEMLDYFDFKRPIFAVNKIVEEGKRYGEPYLVRMIKKGLSYDESIKNGTFDGWTAVEMYLAELIKR